MTTLLGILCLLLGAATAYFANKYYDADKSVGERDATLDKCLAENATERQARRVAQDNADRELAANVTLRSELAKAHGSIKACLQTNCVIGNVNEDQLVDIHNSASSAYEVKLDHTEWSTGKRNGPHARDLEALRKRQNELVSELQGLTATLAARTEESEKWRFKVEWAERQRAVAEARLLVQTAKVDDLERAKTGTGTVPTPPPPPKKRAARTKRA